MGIIPTKGIFAIPLSTMTQLKILQRAQQRDTTALTSILNYLFKEKDITANAAFRGNTLIILLKSSDIPDQEFAVSTIHKLLKKLQLKDLESLEIHAKSGIKGDVAWQQKDAVNSILLPQLPAAKPQSTEVKKSTPSSQFFNIRNSLKIILATLLGSTVAVGIYAFYRSQMADSIATETTPASMVQSPAKPAVTASPQAAPDTFQSAVNQAMKAATLTQTASTPEDWQQVAKAWENAIALMQSVPPSHPRYSIAQQKAVEYQPNLTYAQNNAKVK